MIVDGWLLLDFIDRTPAVRTRLEGNRSGLFQVDTGAAGAVDFYKQFVDETRLLDGRATREQVSTGAGGDFTLLAGTLAWIDFGGRRFRNVEVGFRTAAGREGGGVIGRELLAPFRTIFDYRKLRIALAAESGSATASGCR